MYVFYFFAIVVLFLGVQSLRGGFRFRRYVLREAEANPSQPPFTPFVSVIAPCRGLDQGFNENVRALFLQDYPKYELIFVTGTQDDPSIEEIEKIKVSDAGPANVRILISGEASDSGQKVHNLRVAAKQIDDRSEVLVFVDSDARVSPGWLRSLTAPLADPGLGAATGYRWFIPVNGGFSSHLRSVWNASIASALGADQQKNFCWGGSTAIRRSVFDSLNVSERWRGTVSDDFTVTRVLREANLPIKFVPACLVPSLEDCGFRELLEFTNRQLKITRVYSPHLWQPLLIGSLLFCAIFFGGIALLIVNVAQGSFSWLLAGMLAAIFFLGAAKSLIRLRTIELPLSDYKSKLKKSTLAHLFLWPVASLLYLVNALVAAFSRRIEWRGITYELKSPTEAVIIARE